jgi:NAD(P)-dependent dehydrogenase (short-subunit alcohol dehydrogenase family)
MDQHQIIRQHALVRRFSQTQALVFTATREYAARHRANSWPGRNSRRLQGKTALLTGASRNMGKAIALAFAHEGANLVLNTRVNQEELGAVAAECERLGVRTLPVLADVANAEQVGRMVEQGLQHCEAIDVLASNAAVTAAKTGLLGFILALASELGPHGIRANMVMPGFTDTERRYPE